MTASEQRLNQLNGVARLLAACCGVTGAHQVAAMQSLPTVLDPGTLARNAASIVSVLKSLPKFKKQDGGRGCRSRSELFLGCLKHEGRLGEALTGNLVKPLMGYLNQVLDSMFGVKYKCSAKRQRGSSGEQVKPLLLDADHLLGRSVIDIALESNLCSDFNHPGHPGVLVPDAFEGF